MRSPSPRGRRSPSPRGRRSPSPRGRHSPSRKQYRRRSSPGGYKRARSRSRSRSRSRGRRPQSRRSPSPKYRRRSSPIKRSRSPRRRSPRRSPRRSRSPRRRSPRRDRFEPKPLQMDRVPAGRDLPPPRMPSPILRPKLKDSDRSRDRGGGPGGMRAYGMSPEKPVHERLADKPAPREDFEPYHDDSDEKSYWSAPIPLQRTKTRFDQTEMLINERFSFITDSDTPFVPNENITIGIERNIPGDEPAIIRKEISPNEVMIIRQKDEGSKVLSARAEFLGPKEEVVEKRTIRVAGESTGRPRSREDRGRESRDPTDKRQFLTDRWTVQQREESPVAMYKKQGMTREELDDFLLDAPTPRSRQDREERMTSSRGSRTFIDERDERIVLDRDHGFTVKIDQGMDKEYRNLKEKSKFERDPSDLRHNLSKKRGGEKDDSRIDARQKILKKREDELRKREEELKKRSAQLEKKEKEMTDPTVNLPDFSNRPDKFQYNLPPDTIPRGGYYYEHDNRDQPFRGRGRGRGFRGGFRGRGRSPRGDWAPYRGGFGDSATRESSNREWKHDKFEEMEDDKPTSTTKN